MLEGMAPRRAAQDGSGVAGELAIIERIRRKALAAAGKSIALRLGIGDDCAILRPQAGEEIVVTTDFSLEGRHFRRDWHSPQSVGHRTLARGLSDLAAMGARPIAAFLSLALPRSVARDKAWLDGFFEGLLALAQQVQVPLAGGDTSESPSDHVLADITLLGSVPSGKALLRTGACAGDRLFVSGALGGAAVELASLAGPGRRGAASGATNNGAHPHLFPQPRLNVGTALVRRGLASAAMDLSDGLSTDLRHLCEASGVAAEVDADSLPMHSLLGSSEPAERLKAALHGGEDYELLFTARARVKVPRLVAGVAVTEIGRILPCRVGRPTVALVDARGRASALRPGGWEHLR